ncbi:MAG: oligosaccharide flippase family protein [Candidatus Cloacimonadota bacterium]|jgi:O-antigen/teichoic acid export membrane protein|nr:oligosaccharide flippase family protein [Candidatus Cloacimonadota bacterium]
MTLREFIKSFSFYGFLPVFTKFAGFLLVPVYVRVLSQSDYGIAELILSTVGFLTYVINLEFYGAVGRFFFDRESLRGRQKLISTGLYLTLASALVVAALGLVFQGSAHALLFPRGNYLPELRLGLLWAVISAVSTYLSILPRYEKKAGRFVLFNVITVLVKLLSTVLFVVVLRMGIMGILWGHICGASCSTVLYTLSSRKFLILDFSWPEAAEIARFSLPLVPGILLIALYQPLMRTLISRVYDLKALALFSFAYRLTTLMALVESGIRLSWRPLLYENIRKASFGNEYIRISRFAGTLILLFGIVIICMARELILLIGTRQYLDSLYIIGFLVVSNILINLESLRGFGFEVAKKTYMITIIHVSSRALGLLFLWQVATRFQLAGIGIALLIPPLLDYLVKVSYTKKRIGVSTFSGQEALLWLLVAGAVTMSLLQAHLVLRMLILLAALACAVPYKQLPYLLKRFQVFRMARP